MPSNRDLMAAIKELDSEQETEGKNNQELQAILAKLQTAKADASANADANDNAKTAATAKADVGAKADAEAKVKANRPKPPFYVAPGKAIITERGIISGDDPLEKTEIRAEDLPTGKDGLNHFLKTGHILKGK